MNKAFEKYKEIELLYKSISIKSPSNTHLPNHASTLLILLNKIKKFNQNVLELGSGVGHVSIVLSKIYIDNKFYGIEIQNNLYEYSIMNKTINNINNVNFINCDIKNIKNNINNEYFDYVFCNPPHYVDGKKSDDLSRKKARSFNEEDIENFIKAIKYSLKNKGIYNLVIHPNLFVNYILLLKKHNLLPQEAYICYGKNDSDSQLISIFGRKNGGENFIIKPPIYFVNSNE